MPRRPALIAALAVAVLAPVAVAAPSSGAIRPTAARPAAVAYQPTPADRRIATLLTGRTRPATVGRAFSGSVVDVESNRVIWSRNGSTPRLPASTVKLVTATNALTVFGPAHRFTTTVRRGSTWGEVVLVGSGDPSLSSADLNVLARSTAAAVKAQRVTSVRVWADDRLFPAPSLASGWKRSYVPSDIRWVRALVVDGRHAADTSLDAAKIFAVKLKAQGLSVTAVGRAGAPAGSPVVASVQGARLDSIVRQMMLVSDNDHAEALHRLVAIAKGYPPTWAGAARAQRAVLAGDGVRLPVAALRDGSGLSRADRLTTTQLALVVDNILEPGQSDLATLTSGGLPVAGRTGTLRPSLRRYVTWPTRCAAGRVVAKTGSLTDVTSLAGYTRGTDGRLKAFAFVVNGTKANLKVRRTVDALAATVTGCY